MSSHESSKSPALSINDLPGDNWETRFSKQVARNIFFYKDAQKLTTKQLMEACNVVYGAEGEIKLPTLNGLFAGKRKSIGLAEIMIFARALNVAPILLMVPVATEGWVEIVPGENVDALDAFYYVTADDRARREDRTTGSYRYAPANTSEEWYEPLWTLQRHDELLRNFEKAYVAFAGMSRLNRVLAKKSIDESLQAANNSLEHLAFIRRRANDLNVTLAPLPLAIASSIEGTPIRGISEEVDWPEIEDRVEQFAGTMLRQLT